MLKKILIVATTALLLAGCSNKNSLNDTNIVIGCSPTPHAVILEAAKPLFEEKGYNLEIKVLNDYVTPNTLLDSGDLDANYFQHRPYLKDFNESNGTNLDWICAVHFEPMGLYSLKHTSIAHGEVKVAIPNDKSNKERALNLLSIISEQFIFSYTTIEVEAQALPSILADVDYAVINGNYALAANITNKCLGTEDFTSEIAERNANVIAIKKSSKNLHWVKVIQDVFSSNEMRCFINTHFGSSVKAVF